MDAKTSPMSLGMKRVRLTFNPSKHGDVDDVKECTAAMIDFCDIRMKASGSGEEIRLWALAMTAFEEAGMWAVKAATIDKG